MADDARKDAKNVVKSLGLIATNLNNLVLMGSDFAVDKIAQSVANVEVSDICEDPAQRKELDQALAVVLDFYLSSYLGPGVAYFVTLGATLGNRYSFEAIESDEESPKSSNDSTDGKAGTRQDNDPEGSAKGRNTGKKTKSKKGFTSLPPRGRHVS